MGKEGEELTTLLTKLYTMQEDTGAKPKSTEQEKKAKAQNVAVMGVGGTKKSQKTGSRFLELKSSIVGRLQDIHGMIADSKQKEKSRVGFQVNEQKETIAAQAKVREEIRQATDEWKELENIYRNEARKKRSKFTPDELEVQQVLVMKLQDEIEKCKEASQGTGRRMDPQGQLNSDNLAFLAAEDIYAPTSGGKGGWKGGTKGAALTGGQQSQIQALQERDAEFDTQLDDIGEGIQDLAEIAELQSEEVKRQNQMLDDMGIKMDSVHEHVQNVNLKLKDTLKEVGRSSDKLCVDIMCIVLMLGFAGVLFKMLAW